MAAFFYTDENYLAGGDKLLILLQVLIMTVLIPVAFFFLLRTLGKIDTVMASEAHHRKMPLALQVALLLILICQTLTPVRVPELFFFFLAALVTSFAAMLSAFVAMKPSLHMAALGAMLFFFIGLSLHNQQNLIGFIALLLAVNGLVASSRLQMDAHSRHELVFGFAIGIIPQIALWQYWL